MLPPLRMIAGSFGQDRAQFTQEGLPLHGALHQHAAAVQRVDLAARQIQFAQPVQRAGDRRLGHVQIRRQAAHRMPAVIQVAGQEHAQLPRRQVGSIPTHQRNDCFTQDSHQLVGCLRRRHFSVLSSVHLPASARQAAHREPDAIHIQMGAHRSSVSR